MRVYDSAAPPRADIRTDIPAVAIRTTTPRTATRATSPMTARKELYVSCTIRRTVIQTAFISWQVIPVKRGSRSIAIALIQQPLIQHSRAVLTADVGNHAPARRIRMPCRSAGVGTACDIRLFVPACGYDLKFPVV